MLTLLLVRCRGFVQIPASRSSWSQVASGTSRRGPVTVAPIMFDAVRFGWTTSAL
jgi:hypothetical protein